MAYLKVENGHECSLREEYPKYRKNGSMSIPGGGAIYRSCVSSLVGWGLWHMQISASLNRYKRSNLSVVAPQWDWANQCIDAASKRERDKTGSKQLKGFTWWWWGQNVYRIALMSTRLLLFGKLPVIFQSNFIFSLFSIVQLVGHSNHAYYLYTLGNSFLSQRTLVILQYLDFCIFRIALDLSGSTTFCVDNLPKVFINFFTCKICIHQRWVRYKIH